MRDGMADFLLNDRRISPREGACQWCKIIFPLTLWQKIPRHRNTGDKYDCLGSEQIPLQVKRAGA